MIWKGTSDETSVLDKSVDFRKGLTVRGWIYGVWFGDVGKGNESEFGWHLVRLDEFGRVS